MITEGSEDSALTVAEVTLWTGLLGVHLIRKIVLFKSTGIETTRATSSRQNELNSRQSMLFRALPVCVGRARKFGRNSAETFLNRTQVITEMMTSTMTVMTVANMFAVTWLRPRICLSSVLLTRTCASVMSSCFSVVNETDD